MLIQQKLHGRSASKWTPGRWRIPSAEPTAEELKSAAVLARCLDAMRAGRPVGKLLASHPQQAVELRELLAIAAMLQERRAYTRAGREGVPGTR